MVSQIPIPITVVFYDQHYPLACQEETLHRLIPGSFHLASATELADCLEQGCTLLISFHGAYFPKAAWRALLHFLERRGNLAVFGGMPFSRPVADDGQIEPEQDTYTRQIGLGPFSQLSLPSHPLYLVASEAATLLRDDPFPAISSGSFWSFQPMLTQVSDHHEDPGSAGPLDTLLTPLVFAQSPTTSGQVHRVATPFSLLDHQAGRFKGGRWLLSPWLPGSEEEWLHITEALHRLISLAIQRAAFIDLHPTLGCYDLDEAPTFSVTARTSVELHACLLLYPPDTDWPQHTIELTFPASSLLQEQRCRLPIQSQPGLYRAVLEYRPQEGLPLAQESGFWIWDEELIASTAQKRLTTHRDYLYQGEHLFLAYGTTYMDGQVQRKFLHLPNPARWHRDMGEMRATGINIIRTGIWTGWRDFMPQPGRTYETFLRALDAFILTACKHDLQVIFTFFSFYPPLFEGVNPWLDPRSIEAQQDFLTLLAQRYARIGLLSWDLINEPSFGDPAHTFAKRPLPNDDHLERKAFQQWLAEHYTLSELQLRWRQTPHDLPDWEHVLPPRPADYVTDMRATTVRAMFTVADYTHFSQAMFRSWTASMVAAIRSVGGRTLIGVGQDEAEARLSPQYFASEVDYTTTHPWWNIDDLLWDMLLDKTPDKPNLIQETGVMQLRDLDGHPWRSEQANADLLERKLFTGLIARGAGMIQWLWHVNSYMANENENSIALVRADGSIKPEMLAMQEFGRLVHALKGRLREDPTYPEVWVVIPYSQWFARPELGRLSTQHAVRVLSYELGILPQMIGEHQLSILQDLPQPPQTIIVPGLQLLDTQAWQHLEEYVQRGGRLLINGLITRDSHNLAYNLDLEELPVDLAPLPVSHYETVEDMQGNKIQISFRDEKINYVRKAHNRVYCVQQGTGTLIWCGLPLELATETTATRTLYAYALNHTGVPQENNPVLISKKCITEGELFLIVSDSSQEQTMELANDIVVTIGPNRAGALLLDPCGKKHIFGGLTM